MKRFAALLLISALLLPLAGQASRHVTIRELREQITPWRQTYTAHGRTVAVDVRPRVPLVDAFPALIARSLHPSPHAPVQPPGKGFSGAVNGYRVNNNERSFIYDKASDPAAAVKPPNKLVVISKTWRLPDDSGESCPAWKNPAALKDAEGLLHRVAAAYFPGEELSFAPWAIHAGVDARVLDREQGRLREDSWPGFIGSFRVDFRQLLRGIPVLGTVEQAYQRVLSQQGDNRRFAPEMNNRAFLRPRTPDKRDWALERVILNLVQEREALAADLPLCGMDRVVAAYERLIEAGRLRRVDSLCLGYVGWYHKKAPDSLTLLPCWVLTGLLYENEGVPDVPEGAAAAAYQPEARTVLVNAQTGDLIDPWRGDHRRSHDVPELILRK